MAEQETTLLARLAPWIDETVATRALAHILNQSAASRRALDGFLRDGGVSLEPITQVETEVYGPGGIRVDMVCNSVGNAKPPVLVELKFLAGLTANQPTNYLRWLLSDGNESALLFIAPESRVEPLWPQLTRRVEEMGQQLSGVGAGARCVRVGDTRCHLMLVSWETLLEGMAVRTRADGEEPIIEENIRQLSGLARCKSEAVAQVFAASYLELGPDIEDRRERDLRVIIDGAIENGVREGWASREGLSTSRFSPRHPHGRYFKLTETSLKREVWLGVDNNRWKGSNTPLWVWFNPGDLEVWSKIRDHLPEESDSGWVPVRLKRDVEMNDVVDDVTSQLKDMSDIIRSTD